MIYHPIDFFILRSIFKSKTKISTWDLAKKYNWNDSCKKNSSYWRFRCNKILQRLRVMEDAGLIIVLEKEYNIIKENVKLKKLKLPDGKIKECLWIKETGNKWQIFET